jgi:hypothetical protein
MNFAVRFEPALPSAWVESTSLKMKIFVGYGVRADQRRRLE